MAKSKKSKILAMALCASVMTGIYASPVMAGTITGIPGLSTGDDVIIINGVTLKNYGTVGASEGNFANAVTITNGWLKIGEDKFYVNATDGNTEIEGTLKVTGNTTLGVLNAGATTLDSLTVTGTAELNGGLNVSGAAKFNGMLTADAGLTVTSNGIEVEDGGLLVEQGLAELNGGLSVTGGAKADSLDVTKNATVGGTLTAGSGNFTVDTAGNTTIFGADKQLTVEGTAQIGTMTATTAQVGGDLTVGGDTTLVGLTANGAANLKGGLTVSKGATVNGGLTVDTDRFVVDGVTGNTTVGGTLDVTGQTTLNGLTAGATTVGSLEVTGGNFTVDADGNTTVGGTLDVTGQTTLKNTKVNGTLTAGDTTVDSLTVKGAAAIDSLEVTKGIKAAGGTFKLTEEGELTVGGKAIFNDKVTVQNGLSVAGGASVDGNFAVTNGGLSVTGGKAVLNDGLTVTGDTILNGKLDVGAGNFKVDTNGNTEFNGNLNINHGAFEVTAADGSFSAARDKFNVFADGSFNAASENFKVSADGAINADSLYLQTYGDGTLEVGKALQALTDAKLPDKVGGIERDPEAAGDPGNGTTTIENGAEFTETAMTMGDTIVESGKITVGAEADNQTIIEGGEINTNTINAGGTIINNAGMTVGDTVVESGKITVGAADNQTVIEGGEIIAERLELDGKDVGETIFGIVRDPENEVTTIEGATSFDSNGMNIKDDAGFGTSLDKTGMSITANGGSINLSTKLTAGFASFSNNGEYDTVISGGRIETGSLKIGDVEFSEWKNEVDGRLDKLEYKTQNIKPGTGAGTGTGEGGTAAGEGNNIIEVPVTEDGTTGINGNVTVGGEINAGEIVVGDKGSNNKTTINGGNVTVNGGENGSTTINGGNITTGGTTIDGTGIDTVNGNFSGEVTVGGGTTITGEGITTGTGTFDDVDVDGKVTVGEGTTITGAGITTGTGTFDDVIIGGNTTINSDGIKTNDITADTGTIGNVDMNNTGITVGGGTTITEDIVKTENIKADGGEFDSQVTVGGNTTITDGKINLGGDNGTNINADGMTVGAGTDIKDGNITVKGNEGKVEIGKGDVAIFDENGEKVTSIQHNYDEINRVEEKFDGEVNRLDNRITKVEDRIDKVGAMSAAIANLRTMGYDPAAPTEIAVGVGQYRSETGVALGMFHYPNKDFMLSLSVSTSGDEVMGGIGATWKFGRKSPEKVLAAEKEKAAKAKLAKAEAMKQAAKEAKIKAQQERHAKLAAERAAQEEAAK